MDSAPQVLQEQSRNSVSIDTIESSIQSLQKSWLRRKRWKQKDQQENDRTRAAWRTHLFKFLESLPIRVLAILLLLFDFVISIIDLSSSLVSCTTKETKAENELYHWGGIAILSVLLAKTLALVLALGRSFFRHPGHVVDGFVVIGALLLEAFLKGKGSGLIVVVSLWRVVKVVESALELSDEAIEAQIEEIVSQFQVLRDENRRLQETISGKDKRIEELEEALERCRDQCRLDRLTPTKV